MSDWSVLLNQAHTLDAPIAPLFAFGCRGRRATDQHRWAIRMISRVHTFAFSLLAVFAFAGCASTADLAKSESSTCEVHNCAMIIQVVDCAPGGFSGYRPEYDRARRTQFPHHGRIHFSEDHGYMYARHLRTYVCADCTKAHDQWLAEHANK